MAEQTSCVLLVPAFPRPNTDPPMYTHALTRNVLQVKDGPLKRIDLQLIQMATAAKTLLSKDYGLSLRKKFFLSGFSASAMFVNRFAFLHPELTAAVVAGAPGGWPLAPIGEFNGRPLKYPVGIDDVTEIAGKKIDFDNLRKVPFFFYIGDKDENDSVVYRDGYSKENEDLIFQLFGKKAPPTMAHSGENLFQSRAECEI